MTDSTTDTDKVVGARIAQFRASLGLTQAAFAARVGGTKRGLQGNETGVALPNSKLLLGMVDLGVNLNWLMTGQGSMRAATERVITPVTDDAVDGAVAVIKRVFLSAEAQKNALTAEEAELLSAFRAASAECRQILLAVARSQKLIKAL